MNTFLLDASALVKRYAPETGAAIVNALLARVASDRVICLMLGAAEVAAELVRKRNDGRITRPFFAASMTRLQNEVLTAPDVVKLPTDNALINASIPFSDTHGINATDAIVLRVALDVATQLRTQSKDLVLVAADQRLLRAAQAEGLMTLDPETQTEADVDALVNV